jgi:hypothetical protein
LTVFLESQEVAKYELSHQYYKIEEKAMGSDAMLPSINLTSF